MIKIADISLGTLITDTFIEYSKDFMLYLKNLLFIYIIPTTFLAFFLSITLTVFQLSQFVADISKINFSDASQIGILVLIGIVYFIFFILSALIGSLFTSSIFRIRKLKQSNMNIDEKTVFRDAKRFIMPNIGLGIVQFLAVLGICLLGLIPIGIYFGTQNTILTVLVSVITGILILVLITNMMVRWSFSGTALIYDNKKIMESLNYSKSLVKGNFWDVFLKVMVIGLIVSGISSLLQLPVFLISFILSFIPVVGTILVSAINATILAVVTPIGVIFITKLYSGIKENKQNKLN